MSEAAHHIDVPVSTFRTWTHGYERRRRGRRAVTGEPIVTTLPRDAGVSVPFVGLAQTHALAAIRRFGCAVRNNQRVSNEIIDSYLRRVEFASDGWAQRIHLPGYGTADVVVDPHRSFGLPIFAKGAVRLETVITAVKAGTDIVALTAEFGVPRDDLLSVLGVHTEAA